MRTRQRNSWYVDRRYHGDTMTPAPCSCPIAGWCNRHNIDKPAVWHQLCQSRESYRAAWDDGRGPGQPRRPLTSEQLAKQERIQERVAATERLIGWLRLLRLPDEQGAGDTASRLISVAARTSEAKRALERLLAACACSRSSAVDRLNRQWPW